MIISKIEHSSRIESLHPLFGQLFHYIKTHALSNKEMGKIYLKGDELFVNHVMLEGISKEKQPLEIHRDYIDIHILLDGEETIGWKAAEDLQEEIRPYVKDEDCAFYSDHPTSYMVLHPGEFAVVFPEDAHAPAIGKGNIHKLIAKIKV